MKEVWASGETWKLNWTVSQIFRNKLKGSGLDNIILSASDFKGSDFKGHMIFGHICQELYLA